MVYLDSLESEEECRTIYRVSDAHSCRRSYIGSRYLRTQLCFVNVSCEIVVLEDSDVAACGESGSSLESRPAARSIR